MWIARFVLIKFPIAAAITEAFQVNMNIAPAPYKNEKRMQKIETFKLLSRIWEKVEICNAPPVILTLIDWIVTVCEWNVF